MFLSGLFWLNVALIWLAAHGSAFADGSMPMWWRPRCADAPEWDTDANGLFRCYATWLATLMDLVLLYFAFRRIGII